MTLVVRTTAVGVFEERTRAELALDMLHQAGFTDRQIGFVVRDHTASRDEMAGEEINRPSTTAGAVSGGFVGGVIGALTSLLIPGLGPVIAGGIWAVTVGGVAFGALVGGFAGSLAKMGVPEEEARYYQEQLQSGRVIVTVEADGRYQDAVSILRQAGASSYNVWNDMTGGSGTANMVGAQQTDAANSPPTATVPSSYEDSEDQPTVPLDLTTRDDQTLEAPVATTDDEVTEAPMIEGMEDTEIHSGPVNSPLFPTAFGAINGPVAPMPPATIADTDQVVEE